MCLKKLTNDKLRSDFLRSQTVKNDSSLLIQIEIKAKINKSMQGHGIGGCIFGSLSPLPLPTEPPLPSSCIDIIRCIAIYFAAKEQVILKSDGTEATRGDAEPDSTTHQVTYILSVIVHSLIYIRMNPPRNIPTQSV